VRRMVVWAASLCLAALVGAGVALVWVGGAAADMSGVPPSLSQSALFRRFVAVYEDIRQQTIWPNSSRTLLTGAINGMVGTLHDQFSDYLPPAQYAALNGELASDFTGIGIELGETAGKEFRILSVFPDSPAERAGLAAADQILRVNGRSVAGQSAAAVAAEIRGRVNTSVTLTVQDGGRRKTYRLTRQVIALPTVYTAVLPHHVGYMAITEFGYSTGRQVLQGYRTLMRQHVAGILLDLRDNPGGDVAQARIAAGAFVPKGVLATLVYKGGVRSVIDSPGPGTHLPVVVMVNGDTASAAEILSAAIQQRHVGILVGTKTYGKGIVQEVEALPGGAYLKLTVAKYLTPDGAYIEHRGLTPNIVVPEPAAVVPSDSLATDPQLRRGYDILLRRMAEAQHRHP
jgi:carboxyl-terminal processing protease